MAVMMPQRNWTDECLDHFEQVNKNFDQVNTRLERIETNVSEMQIAQLGIQRVMVQGFIAICTVMAGGFAAMAGVVG